MEFKASDFTTRPDKGKLWWKKRWISICSRHKEFHNICDLCHSGSYHNVWKMNISDFIFKLFPGLWRWYVNRN